MALPKLSTCVNALLFLAGIPCLIIGVVRLITDADHTAGAGTALAAGLILLLAATIDRFESLKGWGMEATTRKLDDKINEADKLFAHIKGLAELTSTALVKLNAGLGRMGIVPTVKESHALVLNVREALAGVGTPDDQIYSMLRPWAFTQAFDLTDKLLNPLNKKMVEIRGDLYAQVGRLPKPLKPTDPDQQSLHERLGEVNKYYVRFNQFGEWPLESFPENLLAMVNEAPELPDTDRDSLRKNIESWLPELHYLIEKHEFLTKDRWYIELEVLA